MRLPSRIASLALTLTALAALETTACRDSVAPQPLTAPTALVATATSANGVRLSFDRVGGATGYTVQRAGDDGAFATVGTSDQASFDDWGLEPGATYEYRVAATRGGETSEYSATARATTLASGGARGTLGGSITAGRRLSADTVYLMSGVVRVRPGATLYIGAGTTILGDTAVAGSSLLVERGARIVAEGTARHPIVFTSARAPGRRRPGDWGGISIVGNARVNLRTQYAQTEGPPGGTTEYLGGTNDADDSGVLRYVRVEFAGREVMPNLRMNSVSFYAVGSGTKVDHVEALDGLDDAFKFFGGTVDGRYLVAYEPGDDHFDISQGYRGRLQYVVGLTTTILPPYAGDGYPSQDHNFVESDNCETGIVGCPADYDAAPYSGAVIANFTAVGPEAGDWNVSLYGGNGLMLRRGTGATLVNGVVARWPKSALTVRDEATSTMLSRDSLTLSHILLAGNAANFDPDGSFYGQRSRFAGSALEESGASVASLFTSLPETPTTASLDWTPAPGSPLASGGLASFGGHLAARAGSFVTPTSYRGAADPNGGKWWEGWTVYVRN